MLWIATAGVSKEGSFASHHWPTGYPIRETPWLPIPSLIDTPLQLLKTLSCLDTITLRYEHAALRARVAGWITELHQLNSKGAYAFFHRLEDPDEHFVDTDYNNNPKYRLSDHNMISMALHCVEQLGKKYPEYKDIEHLCYYPYEEVRSKALKRFTVEHPASKQRMLATSRWSDKTRFMFHSKDTYRFAAADMGFFLSSVPEKTPTNKPDRKETRQKAEDCWTKLLEAQAYQEEYQQPEWNKPLWYALVCALLSQDKRVNNKSFEKLLEIAVSTLPKLSWYNGLFPGLLEQNCVPAAYASELDRDDYWSSTFEIPSVLWRTSQSSDVSLSSKSLSIIATTIKDKASVGKHVPFNVLNISKNDSGFMTMLDSWLLAPPADFSDSDDCAQDSADTAYWIGKLILDSEKILSRSPDHSHRDRVGVVIDVPKWSLGAKISQHGVNSEDMCKSLKKQDAWESKKRIIWLRGRDRNFAMQCYRISPPDEKESLLCFLHRHTKPEIYFFDNATAASDDWETELHLSFYRLSQSRERSVHSLESPNDRNSSRYLALSTMSFRFSGTFSDRIWTCHFLEDGTERVEAKDLGSYLYPLTNSIIRGNLELHEEYREYCPAVRRVKTSHFGKPWQQRRILELLIYSKMLTTLHKDTEEVVGQIRALVLGSKSDENTGQGHDPFQNGINEARRVRLLANEDTYLEIAARWREYMQIILVIERNLAENLDTINKWHCRVKARQSQQPCWSKPHQSHYGATISSLTVYTEKQAEDIRELRNQLSAFRESMISQLDYLREDISFRGSQNINLFTYVTVVFMPLGFATGILSMSGPPEHALLMSLVPLALAAMGITIFMLINAKNFKFPVAAMMKIILALIFPLWAIIVTLWQITMRAFFCVVARPVISYVKQHTNGSQRKDRKTGRTNGWYTRWKEWYTLLMTFSLWREIEEETRRVMPEVVKKQTTRTVLRKTKQSDISNGKAESSHREARRLGSGIFRTKERETHVEEAQVES